MSNNIKPTKDVGTDPGKEGFRLPPEQITEPCLTYMARVMEMREFVAFYFTFVKSSKELGKLIPPADSKKKSEREFSVLRYDYSVHRSFLNQVILSRAVESFDLYLITILRNIFLSKPEILSSEGKIDIATIIEVGNYKDLISRIAEQKIHELSYKSLLDLRKFVSSRTGIDLFPDNDTFNVAMMASELRNLIAHNDCIVNDVFRHRTKEIPMNLSISDSGKIAINDEWLRRTCYTLDAIVFRFDEHAASKFSLKQLPYPTPLIRTA